MGRYSYVGSNGEHPSQSNHLHRAPKDEGFLTSKGDVMSSDRVQNQPVSGKVPSGPRTGYRWGGQVSNVVE
ncbi:hypothetical protein CHU98_g9326 [Xylaria longipes]|nr:hypothetical protein CHU98_g9326 [Xylaria longipes]